MRIAVLGAEGMLGKEFVNLSAEVIPFGKKECDVTSEVALRSMLGYRPDVVINCAGIVRSRINNFPTHRVIQVNTLAPHVLARMCTNFGARFIHISTDCVFDGITGSVYDESSQPTPDDFYAVSKLAGEVHHPKHTTIRTSFVSPSGGLLGWARTQTNITGYDEEFWNGLTTKQFAKSVLEYIKGNQYFPLVHMAGVAYSKYDILRIAKEVYGWPYNISKGPTPDQRKRSRILSSKYVKLELKFLDDMMREMK